MWFWIGFATAIVIMTITLFLPWSKFKNPEMKGPFQLQSTSTIGDLKDTQTLLSASNTGTFLAFVYPLAFQRTGKVTLCSDGTTPQPGEPDCNSGRFGICACEGTDCTKCKHIGYANIINISDVVRLEMLTSPDASRQNAALVQLVVRTLRQKATANTTEVVEETLVLPMIPIQKWTMITIARDGRRYDVYYNNKLVTSKRTEHVLDINSAVGPITAGGQKDIYGSITNVEIFPNRFTQAEVAAKYSRLANTNGEPYSSNTDVKMQDFLPICKDGACLKGPSVRPSSPLMDWDTLYA
jgi:hypothetical protein